MASDAAFPSRAGRHFLQAAMAGIIEPFTARDALARLVLLLWTLSAWGPAWVALR